MGDFLEAFVLLLPADAGGRILPICPRDGTYRPVVGSMRVRFIEGPPTIEPGSSGLIVAELETAADRDLGAGSELEIVEHDRVVGILTVTRLWRKALAV